MVDVAAEHDKLLACLQQIADDRAAAGDDPITVYDSDVPTSPPTDADRRVLPYVVLWPSIGVDVPPTEQAVTHTTTDTGDGLLWTPQATVAAGRPSWVLGAVGLVREALAAYTTTAGHPLVEDTGGPRTPVKDPDESDTPRWFVVLPLRGLLPS